MFTIDIKINNRPKYCIKIQNISDDTSKEPNLYKFVSYKVEGDREYHGEFEHVRAKGLLECTAKAIEAIEKSETDFFIKQSAKTWKDYNKSKEKYEETNKIIETNWDNIGKLFDKKA